MVKSQRMVTKVYLGDLHIGDGTFETDFEYDNELADLIESLVISGCSELVIVGDGLELVNSNEVKSLGLLPYPILSRSLTSRLISDIESRHIRVFDAFRRFSEYGKIVYVVGNHDHYLLENPELRNSLIEALGGQKNVRILPFYYDAEMQLFTLHGNQFDIVGRFSKDDNGNLLAPFGNFMARYMVLNFEEKLKRLNAPVPFINDYRFVHPTLDVFQWFEHIRQRYDVDTDLLELWTKTFIEMLKTPEAQSWLKTNYPRLRYLTTIFVNRFGGMKFGEWIIRVIMSFRRFMQTDYLYRCARRILGCSFEKGFKKVMRKTNFVGYCNGVPEVLPTDIKGVIMGHNHRHTLRGIPVDGELKFYANTGTWQPVVEMVDRKSSNSFVKRAQLSYLIVQKIGKDLNIESRHVMKLNGIVSDQSHGSDKFTANEINIRV